jgi:hypothetical protein
VAQGVHDALTFDASQRPGEERQVEGGRRYVDLRSPGDREGNAVGELGGQGRPSRGDLFRVRIDGEDGRGRRRVAEGQSAVAAAELEHAETVDGCKSRKRVRLCSFRVDPPSHDRIMAPAAWSGMTTRLSARDWRIRAMRRRLLAA